MLERERNDVLDSFKGRCAMGTRESLGYHDSNSTVQLSRIPMYLIQYLLVECRKAKIVLIAVFVDIWNTPDVRAFGR